MTSPDMGAGSAVAADSLPFFASYGDDSSSKRRTSGGCSTAVATIEQSGLRLVWATSSIHAKVVNSVRATVSAHGDRRRGAVRLFRRGRAHWGRALIDQEIR